MCRGFTLIELVLVIVIAAIIGSIGARILSGGFSAYLTGKDLMEVQWQGNLALERLGRDLRNIRSATVADLTIAPANAISFTTTDGGVVSYTLNGNTLQRNSDALADDITNLAFTYLANDGQTTATSANEVYYIIVTLNTSSQNINQTISTVIHPRNFL